jgi:hypothetical protein
MNRFFKIIYSKFFPNWKEVKRGPLTIRYEFGGKDAGEKSAAIIVEQNIAGRLRYIIDEGDGFRYEVDKSRLY